jgi:hypothetical protein
MPKYPNRGALSKTSAPQKQKHELVFRNKSKLLDVVSEEGISGSWSGTLGTCWTKEEFVEQARGSIPPFDRQVRVPQRIARVIFDAATRGPKWVKKLRSDTFDWYKGVRDRIEKEELAVHRANSKRSLRRLESRWNSCRVPTA